MRQQRQEPPNKTGHVSEAVLHELQKKSFEELSNELFLMGDGKGQEDLMDIYVQLMQEKCPPDDGSFDFDAAMDEVKKEIAEQADSFPSKYTFLQLLSREDLELLSKVRESNDEAESLLLAVQKEAMSRDKIGTVSNIEPPAQPDGASKKDPRKAKAFSFRALGSIAAIAAITVTLMLGGMVGAQASGLNVFGALAEWTEDFFHFVPTGLDNDPVRNALKEQDIPEDLAPTWVPERFTFQRVTPLSADEGNSVIIEYANNDNVLFIEISKYNDPVHLIGWDYQKDSDDATPFLSFGRKFYILLNLECATATWSDSQSLIINIWGDVSTEEMMDIISSIGG